MLVVGIFLMSICLTSQHWSSSLERGDIKKLHKTGNIRGDFKIGALFPIHGLPDSTDRKRPLVCDGLRSTEGVQLVEAAFYAVDSINRDKTILPEVTVGIEIKDECWSELVALYQTIKLVGIPTLIGRNLEIPEEECPEDDAAPLIGIIGTASGASIEQIQNILGLFQIPQIAYSASTLNSGPSSHLFLSVIPSVYQEAYMIVQILKKFKLNYFSIAYIDENSRISGRFFLQEWAEQSQICVAANVHLPNWRRNKLHYSKAMNKLFEDRRAKVIVCFCDGSNIINLFTMIRELNMTGDFMIIGIHDWLTHDFTANGYEEEAQGSIMIGLSGRYSSDFDQYYTSKTLQNNLRNPWFEEYWEYRFNCKFHSNKTSRLRCTGKEDLSAVFKQSAKVSYVIKSVYAFAYALDQMYKELCKTGPCWSAQHFNRTKYMGHLKNMKFSFREENVDFTDKGSPMIANYDILNFQKINESFSYVKISEYTCDFAQLERQDKPNWSYFRDIADYQLPGGRDKFRSSCSDPCPAGQIRKEHKGGNVIGTGENRKAMCCWSCVPCKPDEIAIKSTVCSPCQSKFWPDSNKTECNKLPITYAQWTPVQFYLAKGLSIFGIILTLFTTIVFLKHRNTPVVKSSTRELCYIILLGVLMQHCVIFLCVAEPSLVSCFLLRVCPVMSYTLVFGALLVKTNRIARLLVISKRRFPNLNPRFMTIRAQGVLVGILILFQIMLHSINVAIGQIYVTQEFDKENVVIIQRCHCTLNSSGIFNLILMLLCCYYAFKTRNIPDNYNEAKFIGFLVYITTLIGIANSLIYYDSQWKMLSIGICMSVNGFNVLVFLFFPKMYIILCVPERNTREYFTTATGIRCIIGRKDIITNEQLLKKKFMRKDLKNIEDLCSFRTSSTKETSDEATKQEF